MTIIQASKSDSLTLSQIIRDSNWTVAQQFHINKENNPKHPSFYTEQWAGTDFERGEIYFIFKKGDTPLGCVAFKTLTRMLDTIIGYQFYLIIKGKALVRLL